MKPPAEVRSLLGCRLWAMVNDFAQEFQCVELILRKAGEIDVKLATRDGAEFGLPLDDVFERLEELLAAVENRARWYDHDGEPE